MTTMMCFEETVYDHAGQEDRPANIELGVSSRAGEQLVYIAIDNHSWRLNKTLSRNFCEAMAALAERWLADNPKRLGRPARKRN
jgi:hypothetical protein